MAYDGKRFTAAARHWALALADDPILDANCWNHYRFHAACAAALAAAGQGQDEPLLDGAAKARCEPTADRQYVSANASLSFRLHEPPRDRRDIWRLRALRSRPVSRPGA